MFKDNREDIFNEKLDILNLCILSNKINVCIIGGGKGAFTKLKGLINRGCNVTVVAKEIIDEIYDLGYDKLRIIKDEYNKSYIIDKHLVIIAVNSKKVRDSIKIDLEENFKLYIDASNFKEGNSLIPMQGSYEGINLSINNLQGNPKGSRYLYNKTIDNLREYERFIAYTTDIRNKLKNHKEYKEILDFIINDDFKFYFDKGKEKLVLELFYEKLFR